MDDTTRRYIDELNVPLSERVKFMKTEITPDEQTMRGWRITANGSEMGGIQRITLLQEKIGIEVDYSMRPEGYDGVTIRETNGGGAVTIPYMIHPETGSLYVGLIKENRPLMGG